MGSELAVIQPFNPLIVIVASRWLERGRGLPLSGNGTPRMQFHFAPAARGLTKAPTSNTYVRLLDPVSGKFS